MAAVGQNADPDDIDFGPRVSEGPSPKPTSDSPLRGQYVTLTVLQEGDVQSLWTNLGLPDNAALFHYLPLTASPSCEKLWERFSSLRDVRGFVIYAIKANPRRLGPSRSDDGNALDHTETLGTISYLDIQVDNRAVEVGLVIFGPALRQTVAATEAHWLVLRHVFGDDAHKLSPPYRRVVWKCNARNRASRRAAERLGYTYEGTFRNHMVIKGRSRDSDYLSIIDDEWPAVRAGLERWLQDANFDEDGKQIRTLEECRGKSR